MRHCILWLLSAAAGLAAVPGWVQESAAQKVPAYSPKVSSVVLFQEETLTVAPDGKRVMHERGAIKFLDKGNRHVSAFRAYNTKSGKIRDFQAWLLTPDGRETLLSGKNNVSDISPWGTDVQEEQRAKKVDCPGDAPVGSVFAWEVTEEEKSVFTQHLYIFQYVQPVLRSRFVLNVPAGWEVRGTPINAGKLDPQISGDSYTWEMRDLPWIPDEEYRPDPHAVAPWLGVTYYPAGNAAADLKPLSSWKGVSSWLSTLVDGPAEATPPIRTKAKELSPDTATAMDRIRTVAELAQKTNYVAVQLNLTRGGGYTPHRAEDVLSKNYGDCKDKATLMRALLKAQRIDSYLVVLYSGDRDYVRPEWPSPFQFNHAIIGIKVPDDVQSPAVTVHPKLGRLLIFDPTDSTTPLGSLPEDEQGSYGLVVAPEDGDLIRLPMLPIDRNLVESTVSGQVGQSGELQAKVTRTYSGAAASRMRDILQDEKAVRNLFERSLSQQLGGVTLTSVSLKEYGESKVRATIDVNVLRFAQLMQGRLLLVSPGNLVPGSDFIFREKERRLPMKIRGRARRNVVRLQIPPGFAPDEVPDPVKVSGEYGDYEAYWLVKDNEIVFDQTVKLKDVTAPAADYAKVKKFFDQFAGAQNSAVVLVKKD